MSGETPEKIGSLQTIRLLGKGAMAKVFLCKGQDGKKVAVKWLDSEHKPWVRRFLREGAFLKLVQHDHIVRYLGSGMWENRPYLVLSYIDGWNLKTYAEKLHQRPPIERYAKCRQIAIEISQALHALHVMGIIHRDVKPTNVLIDQFGHSYLTDFGTIKEQSATEQTVTGVMVGTPTYAAPEQLLMGEVSDKTDQYGLGATLYFLLSRQRPYENSDRREAPMSLTKFDPNIPADLEASIFRLMAESPNDRFESMLSVKESFSAVHDAGLPLAGRQNLVKEINAILDLVEKGDNIIVKPVGIQGSGRQWATKTLHSGAARRQVSTFEVVDSASSKSALTRIIDGAKGLLIIDRFGIEEAPSSVLMKTLHIKPLRLADIRRTIFLIHPKVNDLAKRSLDLYALTGGIPALLTPLIAEKETKSIVNNEIFQAAIDSSFEGLNYEANELIATMRLLNAPASVEEIENISLAPVEEIMPELVKRGIAIRMGDTHWRLRANALGDAARKRLPEEESLQERWRLFKHPPPKETDIVELFNRADDLVAMGQFKKGFDVSEQAIVEAQRLKSPKTIAESWFRQGSLMLDLGRFKEASALLGDLSVWTKGHDLVQLKKRSHAMRARGTLEMRPGSRASATSAVNRLAELLKNNSDPVISCMWAWAIAALGDERAWRKAADKAILDIERWPSLLDSLKWRLYVVRGSFAISDWRVAERLLHEAMESLEPYPCLHWEYQRAACIIEGTPAPDLEDFLPEAKQNDLIGIKNKWIFAKGISPDLTWKD